MAKRVTMLGSPAEDPPPADAHAHAGEPLEQRVQRLEDAVAALQDTRPLEDRVVERVSGRFGLTPPAPEPERPAERPLEHSVTAERRTPPPATDGLPPADAPPRPPPLLERQSWLIFDLVSELRAMVRMFFDVRYHVAWSTRVTVLVLLALIFTSRLWCPLGWVWFIGGIIDKVIDLVLAFFVYRALSREVRRYRELKALG